MVRDLLSDAPYLLPSRDLEVTAEQFDHGEIGSCFAVRDGWRFEDKPIRWQMGMDKLIDQPRFTHAWLADHRKYLSVSRSRLFYDLLKGFNLGLPSHKWGESTSSGSMQTCPRSG